MFMLISKSILKRYVYFSLMHKISFLEYINSYRHKIFGGLIKA